MIDLVHDQIEVERITVLISAYAWNLSFRYQCNKSNNKHIFTLIEPSRTEIPSITSRLATIQLNTAPKCFVSMLERLCAITTTTGAVMLFVSWYTTVSVCIDSIILVFEAGNDACKMTSNCKLINASCMRKSVAATPLLMMRVCRVTVVGWATCVGHVMLSLNDQL